MLHRHHLFPYTFVQLMHWEETKWDERESVLVWGPYDTCPIFVWVSKGVLPLKDIYVSLLYFQQNHHIEHTQTLYTPNPPCSQSQHTQSHLTQWTFHASSLPPTIKNNSKTGSSSVVMFEGSSKKRVNKSKLSKL